MANYKTIPVLSALIDCGGWLEVRRMLQTIQLLSINAYRYSTKIHNQPVSEPDNTALQTLLQPIDTKPLNLLGLLIETKRLSDTLNKALNINDNTTPPPFHTFCSEPYDEAKMPDFTQKLMDAFFQTSNMPASYIWFMADAFPAFKMIFPDNSTLQDFVNHTRLPGLVFKHVETLKANQPSDKEIDYVDTDSLPELTAKQKADMLADHLRLQHGQVILSENDSTHTHFMTKTGQNYLILTDEEQPDAIRNTLRNHYTVYSKLLTYPSWQSFITPTGFAKNHIFGQNEQADKTFLQDETLFHLNNLIDEIIEETEPTIESLYENTNSIKLMRNLTAIAT